MFVRSGRNENPHVYAVAPTAPGLSKMHRLSSTPAGGMKQNMLNEGRMPHNAAMFVLLSRTRQANR